MAEEYARNFRLKVRKFYSKEYIYVCISTTSG